MANVIGINVIEVDGAGAPAIVGAAVSVGAFNILTSRGVSNRATSVTSIQQFTERFGSYFPGGFGAYLLKGFFDNGGQTAYICRATAANAASALLALNDAGGRATLQFDAGYRGSKDPGVWGNGLAVSTAANTGAAAQLRETAKASLAGTDIVEPVDMSALLKLSVKVNADANPTDITFLASDFAAPAQATRAEIRDAINRRTTKLSASLEGNHILLTARGDGRTSLQVTTANTTLGFALGAQPTKGTLAPLTGTSTRLAAIGTLVAGDAVQISDGPNSAVAKLLRANGDTGLIEWSPAVGNINNFNAANVTVTGVRFDLTVYQGFTDPPTEVETWPGLSMESDVPHAAVARLNDTANGSKYLFATDLHSAGGTGANAPAALALTRLAGGKDGVPTAADFIGDQTKKTGFYAFDAVDVQLVTCERTDAEIADAGIAYCQGQGDCMYIGAVPEGSVAAGTAAAYGQKRQSQKSYGALYGPWIKIFDPLGSGNVPARFVPPVGHVMGVYARTESTRGIWKAPAGDGANILGALDVEYQLSDVDHTALVKQAGVNGIRAVAGAGVVVDSSRTLSTDTRWLYVNVRLLFNYVKSSLRTGLRWVRQEPNKDTLWDAIKFSSVTPFLMQLYRQGAFGTGKPAEVFTVICDANNNPPSEIEQGNLKVEVYFYPSRPAETILIIVGQQPSGATATEA